jgi:tRNA(fMet)-specific endonuclease VapC
VTAGGIVADSDLLIDFLRGRDPVATRVAGWLEAGRLRLTAITAFELRLGADFLRRRDAIRDLIAPRTIPLDATGALIAGELFAQARAEGRGIEIRDALIAGVCRRFDLPLATRNVRHFERVPGLRVLPNGEGADAED